MLLITRPQLRHLRKEREQDSVERRWRLKRGIVERYTPIGSGGARCMTTAQLRLGFTGVANIQ
jgi:hypothetical protein